MLLSFAVPADVARAINRHLTDPEAIHGVDAPVAELLQVLHSYGVTLEPVPIAEASGAGVFYSADVPDAIAVAVVARLHRCRAVQAAFLKPPEGLP